MAIKVGGTEVVSNARELKNIATIDSGTVTAFNSALNTDPTKGTLTKTFTQNETAEITLNSNVSVGPVVSATKEVPQTGISSKGNWDVNSTASNYDFHSTAANVTLTPSTITNGSAYGTTPVSGTSSVNKAFFGVSDIRGINFRSNGTRLIILQQTNAEMLAYDLSTAWDITSAGSAVASRNHNSYLNGSGLGMAWRPDGLRSYIPDYGANFIKEFVYVTAWDPSSYSTNYTYSFGSSDFIDIAWGNNGYKLYLIKYGGTLHQFTCSTAYDLSTAGSEVSYTPSSGSASFMSVEVAHDGSAIYIGTHNTSFHIIKVSMSTAYDLSTASDSIHLTTQSGHNNFGLIKFEDSGNRYYWNDYSSGTLNYVQPASSAAGLVLGSGSFASTDVGKRITGNGGDVVLTATSGTYSTTGGSAFTDSSTIAAGSWSMFGLKSAGDADGISMPSFLETGTGFNTTAALENTTPSSVNSSYLGSILDCCVSKDGNYLYTINQATNAMIRQFTMSTPYDLSTASYTRQFQSGVQASNTGMSMNNDGTKMYVTYNQSSTNYLKTYAFGTAYDISTLTNTNNNAIPVGSNDGFTTNFSGKLSWNNDGSKAYYSPYAAWSGAPNTIGASAPSGNYNPSGVIWQYNISTPFDWAGSSPSVNATARVPHSGTSYGTAMVSSDGNWLINTRYNNTFMFVYPLTTPYDISTQNIAGEIFIDTQTRNSSGSNSQGGIGLDHVNGILYTVSYGQSRVDANKYATNQTTLTPTAQYNVAVTNTSGRIDSSAFVDINSMTAAESAGTGTVNYAVSTDGRTTWSVAKGTDGVRPIVRNNSGTWQYNSQNTSTQTGYDFSTFAYASSSLDLSSSGLSGGLNDITISSDGTKIYFIDNNGMVRQHTLSTAYDLSTSGSIVSFNSRSEDIDPRDVVFKPDGTKMYVLGDHYNKVSQYALSTAWDVSTASFENKDFAVTNQMSAPMSVQFKSDGYTMYVKENTNIMQYTLSTAWDVSTASYANKSFSNQSQDSSVLGMFLKPDGTKMYTVGTQNDKIYEYNFGTAFDVATLSYSNNSYSLDSANGGARGITISSDGTKIYIADYDDTAIYQYNFGLSVPNFVTTPTWSNGTVNDELYTLQQALSIGANRMDKTQLDAVADANHFTLGNTLDLMIALRQDTANASSLPKSDGVTLNYDAASLNEGAVLGTDYDFFHPAANKVQIKSLAAQNLKIRVV